MSDQAWEGGPRAFYYRHLWKWITTDSRECVRCGATSRRPVGNVGASSWHIDNPGGHSRYCIPKAETGERVEKP